MTAISDPVSSENGLPVNPAEEEAGKAKEAKRVYVISQEIKIVRALASNNLRLREKQLKKLKTWLALRAKSTFAFNEDDFIRIWKGLFSSMWLSDKPLVQEALAEECGTLFGCFTSIQDSLLFFRAFLHVICVEWHGLDQFRVDKILMLARKMLRYMFLAMDSNQWSLESVEDFNTHLTETVFKDLFALGFAMHITDIFFEELAKVGSKKLTAKIIAKFLENFVQFIIAQYDVKLMGYVKDRIFFHWLWQSRRGREHNEKFEAWKRMGFPTENIDDIEKMEPNLEDEAPDGEEAPNGVADLDPRAGNVDVFVPELPVDVEPVIACIDEALRGGVNSAKSAKILRAIKEKYQRFSAGEFPLGVKEIPKPEIEPMKYLVDKKVDDLAELENDLYSTTRKLKTLNKKQRRKLLASINATEVDEEEFEKVLERKLAKKTKKCSKNWKEEDTSATAVGMENGDLTANTSGEWEVDTEETVEAPSSTEPPEKSADPSAATESEWSKPLEDGEVEYFVKSRRKIVEEANASNELLLNPYALKAEKTKSPVQQSRKDQLKVMAPSPSSPKRVKIALNKNSIQKAIDYIKLVRTSPTVPYDASKLPAKSALKSNFLPSPIDPFSKFATRKNFKEMRLH